MLRCMETPQPVRTHPPIRWPDRRKGPWSLSFHWAEIDGRQECVGIEIWSGYEWHREYTDEAKRELIDELRRIPGAVPATLTAGGLRIPFTSLIETARRELLEMHRQAATMLEDGGRDDLADRMQTIAARFDKQGTASRRTASRGRGRPRQYPPEHFVEVAEVYKAAWNDGDRHPTRAVAKKFGVSDSTAAKWVARARADGALEQTKGPGRPGWVKKSGRVKRKAD